MPGNDPFVRHDAQILIGTESTQGTTVTPDRTLGEITGDTDLPDPTVNWEEERSISASQTREPTGEEPMRNVYDGGSIPVIPRDGLLWALLLGSDSVQADTGIDSTGSTTAKTGTTLHTITATSGILAPTITTEATYYGHGGASDFVRTFAGMAAASGTISVDTESRLDTQMNMQAMGVSTGTSPTTGVSEDSREPWRFHDVETSLSWAGTTYARLTDFEWEITTNLSPDYYIQATNAEDPYEMSLGNIEYDLTLTIVPDDSSLYDDLVARNVLGSASVQFERANGDSVRFEWSNLRVEDAPFPYPEEGKPEVEVSTTPRSSTVYVEDQSATAAYV